MLNYVNRFRTFHCNFGFSIHRVDIPQKIKFPIALSLIITFSKPSTRSLKGH